MSSGTLVRESGCPFLLLVMVGKQNQTAPGANVKAAIPSAGAALRSSIRGSASQVFTDCVVFFKLPSFAKYFPCH